MLCVQESGSRADRRPICRAGYGRRCLRRRPWHRRRCAIFSGWLTTAALRLSRNRLVLISRTEAQSSSTRHNGPDDPSCRGRVRGPAVDQRGVGCVSWRWSSSAVHVAAHSATGDRGGTVTPFYMTVITAHGGTRVHPMSQRAAPHGGLLLTAWAVLLRVHASALLSKGPPRERRAQLLRAWLITLTATSSLGFGAWGRSSPANSRGRRSRSW